MFSSRESKIEEPAVYREACPYCSQDAKRVRVDTFQYIFNIRLFLIKTHHDYKCMVCWKSFPSITKKKNTVAKQVHELNNGAKVSVTTKNIPGEKIITTSTDYSNVLPKVDDDYQLVFTIAAVMALLSSYEEEENEDTDLLSHNKFLFMIKSYPHREDLIRQTVVRIQSKDMAVAREEVIVEFKKAKLAYSSTAMDFIMKQCVGLVSMYRMNDSKEEELLKDLARMNEIAELNLTIYLSRLKSKF